MEMSAPALFAFIAVFLSACGTTHATITTSRGEELMLLGYDPVAYFTDAKPVLGREFWLLDEKRNIERADALWPQIRDKGWRAQSLKAWIFRVPWYRTGPDLMAEWRAKHPGRKLEYDTGGTLNNLVLKYPGWRAREGFSQPAVGVPGESDDHVAR